MVKERRKTRHLTQWFKEYNREELSRVLGVDLDENQAWTIFKLVHKLPMRFLDKYVTEDNLDLKGEKAISLPGVGKYRFMKTIPQGKVEDGQKVISKPTMADGFYPRLKFYPAPAIETEVEVIHGIANKEDKESFDKMLANEEKNIKKVAETIVKRFIAKAGEPRLEIKEKTLQESIEELINGEVTRQVKALLSKDSGLGMDTKLILDRLQKVAGNGDTDDVSNEDLDKELDNLDDVEDYDDEDDEENGDNGDNEGGGDAKGSSGDKEVEFELSANNEMEIVDVTLNPTNKIAKGSNNVSSMPTNVDQFDFDFDFDDDKE